MADQPEQGGVAVAVLAPARGRSFLRRAASRQVAALADQRGRVAVFEAAVAVLAGVQQEQVARERGG